MTAAVVPTPIIRLENPVADHYEEWIIGNAIHWQTRMLAELADQLEPDVFEELLALFEAHRPGLAFGESPLYHDYVLPYAMRYVVQPDSHKGKHLVICGAGPSLAEHAEKWCAIGDEVWGCNSALTYLLDRGLRVTHGFTIDQTPHMVAEWASTPDVDYLCASTVHPHLTELLMSKERRITWFHNFVGIKKPPITSRDVNGVLLEEMHYEDWLYALLYPPTIRAGSGLNAVTRAIDVAQCMGFKKITVLGADCMLRVKGNKAPPRMEFKSPEHLKWLEKHTTMHADGGHALASEASPLTIQATIDGHFVMTKLDMALTAQWLVRMVRHSRTKKTGRIHLIGDGLPKLLMDKDDAFLARLPNFVTADGELANIPAFLD